MYKEIFLLTIFIITAVTHIISIKKSKELLTHLTKSLLMPMLLVTYLVGAPDASWFIILALIWGFLGDVFLMGRGRLFIAGLFSFLMGHIFYIIAFTEGIILYKIPDEFYFLILIYIAYGIIVYKSLLPYINSIKIIGLLYIITIITMSFVSLMRIWNISGYQFWLPFIGSVIFIASDTLLAFSEFKVKVKDKDVYIMLTYITAQLLIILGFM